MRDSIAVTDKTHLHFITGKLAEAAVADVVAKLADKYGFAYSIGVMPITVAALITPKWLRRHWQIPESATAVVVPGYCGVGIDELAADTEIEVICGPNDCRDLPELFGESRQPRDLTAYDISIIAEINHVPRTSIDDVLAKAECYRRDGADVIDLGCDPTSRCESIDQYVVALIDQGFQVSIDSFDPWEVTAAVSAGASLVLSVNSSNREVARDWGAEVVVIPDDVSDEKSYRETIDYLIKHNVPIRLDPILEPIGAGLANSLVRYARVRDLYPEIEMMMGIGNLTELTDVDSAGVNFLLLGVCQELGIRSVLTTEVINWARSSVRECELARRYVHYAVSQGVPPKRLADDLVMLRDVKLKPFPAEALTQLAQQLKDNNYRLFAQDELIHILSAGLHLSNADPFALFDELIQQPEVTNVDPSHAFYLGYEMAKASIALNLGKQYSQDQSLDWGMLTKFEDLHRIKRSRSSG